MLLPFIQQSDNIEVIFPPFYPCRVNVETFRHQFNENQKKVLSVDIADGALVLAFSQSDLLVL